MGKNNGAKLNPQNKPWFPFYAAQWLGSETVLNMTMTERGIYVTLMAMGWVFGSLNWDVVSLSKRLGVDRRTIGAFMEKYMNLTESLHEGSTEVTLPKLQEFSETLAKNGSVKTTEEKREEEKRKEEKRKDSSSSYSAKPKTTQGTPPSGSLRRGFNPLTYAEEVTSEKGEKLVYPGEDVHKTLVYHFERKPSTFWKDKINSALDLPRYIDTMYEQMVKHMGEDWEPHTANEEMEYDEESGAPAVLLNDIREWNEDRNDIPAERLRNCILYHLDYAEKNWLGDITVASMNRPRFVSLLNDNTPPGWTPENHGKRYKRVKPKAEGVEETTEEREQREYSERIARMKAWKCPTCNENGLKCECADKPSFDGVLVETGGAQ